ncbi:MAG: cysteine peptidase family C39 domain-containing protein, partial [Parahaliea sp.]
MSDTKTGAAIALSPGEVVALAQQLAQVDFLSALAPPELARLAGAATLSRYELGDTILRAGEQAAGLLFVRSGRVRLFSEADGKESSIGVCKAGEILGELAALRSYRYEFSCRASGTTEVVLIPAAVFAPVLGNNTQAEEFMASHAAIRAAGGLVSQFFDLRGAVTPEQLQRLVASVGIKSIAAGTEVLQQGASRDHRLYVIRQGRVKLVRREQGEEYVLGLLDQGEIFGEKACLSRQEQMVTAQAESDLVLLVLPDDTVRELLQYNPRLREAIEGRIQFQERELERQKKLREQRGPQFSVDLEARPGFKQRVLPRFPLVQQAEEMDCGAACLAMVCKYFAVPISLGKLRDLVNVTREGASLDSVARAAESLGFSTRGVQTTFAALKNFDFPLIAHWEGYHFVVVYGVSGEHVWVADPGPGFRKLSIEEFEKGWTGTCLLFKPTAIAAQEGAQSSPWRRFFGYLRPHRSTVAHLFLAALVIQLLGLAPPVITQNILDKVIVHENASLLVMLSVGLVLSQLFAQLTTVMRGYLAAFMTRSMDFAMMSAFFQHTLALPVAFFARRRTGDIIARFQENRTIRDFLTGQTVGTVLNVMMVFVYLAVMLMYNLRLTLILLALIVPLFLLTALVTPRMKEYSRRS